MVFVWYFLRRFCIAFFAIAFILALLLNVVEFFEKVVRVSHTTAWTILSFVMLNFLPTFSDLMPIASWLAACLVIREFYHQKEWESLLLLNIDYGALLKLFMLAGFLVASGSLIFREYLTIPLSCQAEQFRSKQFKQGTPTIVTKMWYKIADTIYCYIGFLDLKSKKGEDLFLIHVGSDGNVHKSIRAQQFDVRPETESVVLKQGIEYYSEGAVSHQVLDKIVPLPGLFIRLAMQFDIPSLGSLCTKIIAHGRTLSGDAYMALMRAIFERLFFYAQILLFPAVTFVLFSIFIDFSHVKWFAVLLPYPLFTVISVLVFFLVQKYFSIWILALPFILIFSILLGGILMFQKSKKAL